MAFNRQVTPPPPPGGGFALRPHRPLSHPDTRRRLVNGGARNTVPSPARIRLRMRDSSGKLAKASLLGEGQGEGSDARSLRQPQPTGALTARDNLRNLRRRAAWLNFSWLMRARVALNCRKHRVFLRFRLQICVSKTPLILDLAPVNHEPQPWIVDGSKHNHAKARAATKRSRQFNALPALTLR